MMNLIETRKQVNKLLPRWAAVKQLCKIEKAKLIEAEDNLVYIEEAQEIAQHVAQQIQERAHKQIAGVVTRCLEAVFTGEDVYGFKIRFERKRRRTEAILILTKNGHEVENPLNSDSGGVVDVAAFALRLSCIMLAKPRLRKFLALDEPFKFVSEEYLENVRTILEGTAEDLGFQYVMTTHIKELQTGKVIRL